MAIHIKEILVRAVVTEKKENKNNSNAATEVRRFNDEELIERCVEKVMNKLDRKKRR